MAEKVVKKTDCAIGTLTDVHTLIDEVIDLCVWKLLLSFLLLNKAHLSRYCLAANPEYSTLPRGEKIHRPGLLRVTGIVDLINNVS